MRDNGWPADRIDTQHAHSARVYDYILGGRDHYPVDQEAGDASVREWPAMRVAFRANRDFMNRVVRYMARDIGIRQFLDIGTGIPTQPNLHEVAQEVRPETRVLYVDNDPIVLTLSQGLLESTPEGATAYVEGDIRDPDAILNAPELADTLDLSQPVGLTVIGLVQFLLDDEQAYELVGRLLAPLPPGSCLAMSIVTADMAPEVAEVGRQYTAHGMTTRVRTKAEAAGFFEGLEMIEPGIVPVHRWRPDPTDSRSIKDEDIAAYGALARKP